MVKVIRKLDSYETFFALPEGKNSFNQCIAVGFEGSITYSNLAAAAEKIQRRYPLLRVSIKKEGDGFFYVEQKQALPVKNLVYSGDIPWEKVMQKELHTPIDTASSPLLRIALLTGKGTEGGVMIFTAHHLIVDGISLLHLIDQIIVIIFGFNCKNKALNGKLPSLSKMLESLPENCLDSSNSFRIKNVGNLEDSEVREVFHTGLLFRRLSPEVTESLIKQSKIRNCKLQSCFMTALSFALSKVIWVENCKFSPIKLICQSPVNLRPYLRSPLSLDKLGCYITTLYFDKSISVETNFQDMAIDLDRSLRDNLNEELPGKVLSTLKELTSEFNSFEDLKIARNPGLPFIGVSNLGKFEISHCVENFRLSFVYPAVALQGAFYESKNIYMALVTVAGEVFLSFMYPACLMSRNIAEKIGDDVIDQIKDLVKLKNKWQEPIFSGLDQFALQKSA